MRRVAPAKQQRVLPVWAWPIVAALIFTTGVFGIRLSPPGTHIAMWWPAAGISVLFLLLVAGRRHRVTALTVIMIATTMANAAAGRSLMASVAFGAANIMEVLVITSMLTGTQGRRFQLSSFVAALRFICAIIAGAVTIGVSAGLILVVFEDRTFFPAAGFVAASHTAAVLMIAPFGLLPQRISVRAGKIEIFSQAILLALVLDVVFEWSTDSPLAFLPFPVLAWAAFRFPVRVVLVETLLASVAILVMTIAGDGPFSDTGLDLSSQVALTETYLMVFAGFAIVLSAAQYEFRDATRQLAATSRLLSGSLVEASVGLVIAERRHDRGDVRIEWSNLAATTLIQPDSSDRWDGLISDAALEALRTAESVTIHLPTGRILSIAANHIPDEPHRFAVQLVDMTEPLRLQAATLAAEREREVTLSQRVDLERQRDDFVATTSHELRTPITSIAGYGELLTESTTLTTQERRWVDVITRNAARLTTLVEDLLMLNGLRSDPSPRCSRDMDVAALITEILSSTKVLADQREIVLVGVFTPGTAHADPEDVHRILTNLVENAVKFTPRHGRVTISTSQADDSTLRITVADTGPGMTEHELEHAFDRFYRSPEAEQNSIAGTGLGLAIVAELVDRNRGLVTLDAPSTGGLVATVALPRTADATPSPMEQAVAI